MSDYGYDPSTDPYALSDAELMDYILSASANGGVFGKDPSARLTTLSKMQSLLNGPLLTSMFPQETVSAETLAPQLAPNLQRQVYGNNPVFKALFDTMDSGADPLSAVSAVGEAVQAGKFEGMDPSVWEKQKEQILKVATDYGMDAYKNQNAYEQDVAKYQAGGGSGGSSTKYVMSDGTPYKGSNLGRGTMGMANEYELLGSPSVQEAKSQLIAQWAQDHPAKDAGIKQPKRSTWDLAGRAMDAKDKGALDEVYRNINSAVNTTSSIARATKMGDNKVTDFLVKERLNKAKNTTVRSEESKNLAYKILALRSLAGA